jgi:hypothetical protein
MDRLATILDLRPNTPRPEEERQAIEDILSAAEAWARGECPLNDVMQLGISENWDGAISRAKSRHVAYWTARRTGDPRRHDLARVMDIAADARMVHTRQGYFSRDDLHALRETHMRVLNFQAQKEAA